MLFGNVRPFICRCNLCDKKFYSWDHDDETCYECEERKETEAIANDEDAWQPTKKGEIK